MFNKNKKEIDKNEGNYVPYLGTPVIVITAAANSGTSYGIMDHTDYDKTLLKHCLIDEYVGDKHDARLEDKLPITISTPSIIKVVPLRKGYLEKLVADLNLNFDTKEKKDE